MKLTLLAKDASSGKAGCKSVYLAENGNLLNLLAGEGAVEIDVDIVRAALARLM